MSKFSGLALNVGAASRMTLLNPITRQPIRDSKGNEAWIDLHSASAAIGRKHDRDMTDKQIKMQRRRLSAEEIEADFIEKLSKLTAAWFLVNMYDGSPIDLECTQANARELYSDPDIPWIREQVAEFIQDLGNFPGAASTS